MNPIKQFEKERSERIAQYRTDKTLNESSQRFLCESLRTKYSYNFSWMGRPVIQYPQDLIALQEIIWKVQPDLIIETGIAHGGSLIFYASMLELIGGSGKVIGIDVDIRSHNRVEIERHPLFGRIRLIEGSSVDKEIVQQVKQLTDGHEKVLVCLDSNHTHEHVLNELKQYGNMVTPGSYLVVFDGIIENLSKDEIKDREWGPGNNPLTAIRQFLQERLDFAPDHEIENKLLVTAAPSGYLKRIY